MDSLNDWNKLKCGLIYIIEDRQVPVPLKKVQLDVKVVDFIAQVSVIQEYVNQESNPIEVHYSYPVEESAAIVGFEAVIDGHEIVAEVKEKEKAKEDYDQAMRVSQMINKSKYRFKVSIAWCWGSKRGVHTVKYKAQLFINQIQITYLNEECTRLNTKHN